MEQIENFDELKKASKYLSVPRTVQRIGVGNVVLGFIVMLPGLLTIRESPVNAVLVLLGLLFFVEGIWMIIARNPAGIIITGITRVLLGVWIIGVTILNAVMGTANGSPLFIILGVVFIGWGAMSFRRHKRLSGVLSEKPSEKTLQQLRAIGRGILELTVEGKGYNIEFKTFSSWGLPKNWKGRLEGDTAIFVEKKRKEVFLAKKGEVLFLKSEKLSLRKGYNASFTIGDRTMGGEISSTSFESYEKWMKEDSGAVDESDIDQDDMDALERYAEKMIVQGELKKAKRALTRVLLKEPSRASAQYAMASVMKSTENVEDYMPYYREAVTLEPENAAYRNALAAELISVGEREKAIGHLKESIATDINQPEVLRLLAKTYEEIKSWQNAYITWDELMKIDSQASADKSIVKYFRRCGKKSGKTSLEIESALSEHEKDYGKSGGQ